MPHSILPTSLKKKRRRDEVIATVALWRSRVVPPHRLASYISERGSSVELVRLAEEDRLMSVREAIHEVIGAVTPEDLAAAADEVDEWVDRGLTFWSVLDRQYPRNLRTIFNRPPIVFVEGWWDDDRDSRSVAVVGTRSCTDFGLRRAAEISQGLVEDGFTVLSGMAKGIDTAAHTAALEAGGRTAAVMGTGIDRRYPDENDELSRRIVESGGALLSQFFPEQGPRSWTFPRRNVTMSGLSLATVVVEASETSGAKMQARVALQHGRTVFLLDSLVDQHDWARKYVSEGVYDTRAVAVSTVDEIVDRLDAPLHEESMLAV